MGSNHSTSASSVHSVAGSKMDPIQEENEVTESSTDEPELPDTAELLYSDIIDGEDVVGSYYDDVSDEDFTDGSGDDFDGIDNSLKSGGRECQVSEIEEGTMAAAAPDFRSQQLGRAEAGGKETAEGAASLVQDDDNQQPSSELKIFNMSNLTSAEVIGSGEFGKVHKGYLHGNGNPALEVAAKLLSIQSEADMMKTVAQLNVLNTLKHMNIVGIIGILEWSKHSKGVSKLCPKVILPYFPKGNLLQFSSDRRSAKSSHPDQVRAMHVKLLYDVAMGCEYLHSHGIVHGNLAARNVLVEKRLYGRSETHYNAKVSDYGLIQLTKSKGYGRNYIHVTNGLVVPFRHAPAELFTSTTKGFTFQSDVWSFGVVMWEVFTRGAQPYGRGKPHSIVELIKSGLSPYDLRKPVGYSQEVVNIMKRSFNLQPEDRPTFTDVVASLVNEQSPAAGLEHTPECDSQERSGSNEHGNINRDEFNLDTFRRPFSRKRGPRSSISRGRRPSSLRTSQTREDSGSHGDTAFEHATPSKSNRKPPPVISGKFETSMGPSSFPSLQSSGVQIGGSVSPPPYTPTPLPNHSAVGTSNPSREFPRTRPLRPENVNYDREIERKTQELEKLKVLRLQQEASHTWTKMQSIVSQLTNLTTNTSGSGTSDCPDTRTGGENQRREYDGRSTSRSRRGSARTGSSSGRGRAGRGRRTPRSTASYLLQR